MSAKSKQTKAEQRAKAAENLKAAQEAVKVQDAQTVAPVTSAPIGPVPTNAPTPPEVTIAPQVTNEPIIPDPDLLHKVAEFTAGSKIRFFCMKCKAAKSTKIDETYITPQGHKRAKGICPTCGKKVTRGHLDITPKAV